MNRLTFWGHAAIGIQTGKWRLVIDPFFSGNPAAKIGADQIECDYILVSHGHNDHIGDTVEIAKRNAATVISNSEICKWLAKQGVEKVHSQQPGGGFNHPFGCLKFTQAFHSSPLPDGSYGGNPAGFLLTTLDGKRVYFAGDTGLFGDMKLIGEEGVDIAILPIGDNFTMGPDDALRAVKFLSPRLVIPIHYSTWGIIDQDVNAWASLVAKKTTCQVHILEVGGTFEF